MVIMENPFANLPDLRDRVCLVGNKYYVPLENCPHPDRVRNVYGDKKGFSIRASRGRNGRYVRRKNSEIEGTDELIFAEFVRRVAYMAIPEQRSYFVEGSGVHYVATCVLRALGIVVDEAVLKPVCCEIKDPTTSILNYVSKKDGMGHSFVSVSDAVRAFPSHKATLLDGLYPDVLRPKLPTYSIRDADGTWVSPVELLECCEEEGIELAQGETVIETLKAIGARVVSAEVDTDGSLSKVAINFASGSGPFVSVAWLRKDPRFRGVLASMEPAPVGYPICLADCFRRRRTRFGVQPEKCKLDCPLVAKGHRKMSSVKMSLTSRIKEKSARVFLEKIVDTVSRASRYGSYVMNLHMIRLLDASQGTLSDDPGDHPFVLDDLVRKAMVAVRFGAPKDAGLAATYRAHEAVLKPLVGAELLDFGNAFNEDAKMYVTNALTSFQLAGKGRVATLLKSAARLLGRQPKGTIHKLTRYVEGATEACEPGVHPDLETLAIKYRTMYAKKGLNDSYGFKVHAMPDELKSIRVRRILELYWHVNKDLYAIEQQAVATGLWRSAERHDNIGQEDRARPQELFQKPDEGSPVVEESRTWRRSSFAFLPVSSLKRRHVRIDKHAFTRACNRQLYGRDIEGFDDECFMSLFLTGRNVGRHKRVEALRSEEQGWYVGDSFMTDGTSLVFTYECALRRKGTGPPTVVIPEGCQVSGDDPGRVNVHTTCSRMNDGTYVFRELTRNDYYRDSKFDENKVARESRHKHHASVAIAALSLTRRRTTVASEFAEYVKTVGDHADSLQRAFGCRSAGYEALKAYRYKTKTIDNFIGQHVIKGEKVVYALGNPGFSSGGRGERSVPTSSYGHRIKTAYKDSLILQDVDEWGTTKYCSVTFTELAPTWRKVVCKDGVTRYRQDRDVKLCKSEAFPLGSHSFLVASPALLDGLEPFTGVPLNRDRSSAYAMRKLALLDYEQRPPVYQRS